MYKFKLVVNKRDFFYKVISILLIIGAHEKKGCILDETLSHSWKITRVPKVTYCLNPTCKSSL